MINCTGIVCAFSFLSFKHIDPLIALLFIFTGYSLSPSSSVSTLAFSSNLSIPQSLALTSTAHHHTPPSRVIHCRAVADGCKETDLISVLQPFGKIT